MHLITYLSIYIYMYSKKIFLRKINKSIFMMAFFNISLLATDRIKRKRWIYLEHWTEQLRCSHSF